MLFLCFDRLAETSTSVVRASVPPTPGEAGSIPRYSEEIFGIKSMAQHCQIY